MERSLFRTKALRIHTAPHIHSLGNIELCTSRKQCQLPSPATTIPCLRRDWFVGVCIPSMVRVCKGIFEPLLGWVGLSQQENVDLSLILNNSLIGLRDK